MIKPTIGRVVWYWPGANKDSEQPWAALIAHVHSDSMVNLAVFDANGNASSMSSVPLYQGEGERPSGSHCQWMPYQQDQAAKTEALEKQLKEPR